MLIDCGSCTLRRTDACDDCIVSFLLDRPADSPRDAVVLDMAEERAIRNLQDAGLAPQTRYAPSTAVGTH